LEKPEEFDECLVGVDAERSMMRRGEIKGWCPGVLRPMESGDGLLARLKISCGIAPLPLAAAIAAWAKAWGNGCIDLTSRANLQLRGLTAENLPSLERALDQEGLLDVSSAAEAVRNVVVNPLAGLDQDAPLDVRPFARALERLIAASFHALPPKFGFAVDDGGRYPIGAASADVLFRATRTQSGVAFHIWLDGASDECLGPCAPEQAIDAASALAQSFVEGRRAGGSQIRRMRDWVAAVGLEGVARKSGLARLRAPQARPSDAPGAWFIGAHALTPRGENEAGAFTGIGLPFGRIAAGELACLVEAARTAGATELRLTPWRAILVPTPSLGAARRLAAAAASANLIVDPDDPRRRFAACVGAPVCAQATTDVRGDALRLAPLLADASGPEIFLHLSGCVKGCAHQGRAPVVFVGRAARYDVRRDGAAGDQPQRCGLALEDATRFLRRALADRSNGVKPGEVRID
jgi:precorrin-3B synthase